MSDTQQSEKGKELAAFEARRANLVDFSKLDGGQYKIAKQVTRTVLHQHDGEPFYIQFQSSIRRSTVEPAGDKADMAPPNIADVLNLETGEMQILVMNTVLESELQRAYPNDDYVGRMFGVKRGKSELDKRYKVYTIIEIERVAGPEQIQKVATIDGTSQAAIDNAKAKAVKK
jgi:hypothetical protein